MLYCVDITFVLVCTVRPREEAEGRGAERRVQGLKTVIQIGENESVPNPLLPHLCSPQRHHSRAFLFFVSFSFPSPPPSRSRRWPGDHLFTGSQGGSLLLDLPLVPSLSPAGRAVCHLPRLMTEHVFMAQDSWEGTGLWNDRRLMEAAAWRGRGLG